MVSLNCDNFTRFLVNIINALLFSHLSPQAPSDFVSLVMLSPMSVPKAYQEDSLSVDQLLRRRPRRDSSRWATKLEKKKHLPQFPERICYFSTQHCHHDGREADDYGGPHWRAQREDEDEVVSEPGGLGAQEDQSGLYEADGVDEHLQGKKC